jgi:hypothetical protein
MGSFTAQILVGEPHIYHGGIYPSHYLFLSENDRPAWTMVNQNIIDGHFDLKDLSEVKKKRIVWIPTVEHMLEDALLMIVIHIIENQEVIDLAKTIYKDADAERVEMYCYTDPQRDKLYKACRKIENWPKIVVTLLRDSSITTTKMKILKKYSIAAEVCVSK